MNEAMHCPVCGVNNDEDGECEHLLLHGDDMTMGQLMEKAGTEQLWKELCLRHPRLRDGSPSDFLDHYARYFPSLVAVEGSSWEGGGPGCSGIYTFIYAKRALWQELRDFLEQKLEKLLAEQLAKKLALKLKRKLARKVAKKPGTAADGGTPLKGM